MNAIVPHVQANADVYRASTDAASMCKEIVVSTAMDIQGRRYVKVEGWQAIAIAHGCTCSALAVEAVQGGVRATGEVRRMSDGALIAQAEGFVGEDEPTWFGGEVVNKWGKKTLPARPAYAIRAMAQTRAISRACRSAFAHVVVMMNAGLQTTPAEEVPQGGFDNGEVIEQAPRNDRDARKVLNPETGRMVDPMSSNQAKKDGRAERSVVLANEIEDIETIAEAADWRTRYRDEVATWPAKWQTVLWERFEAHVDDLNAASAAEPEPIGQDDRGNPIYEEAA